MGPKPGQTGFQPPTRHYERRAFFDLQRRIVELEKSGGSGGGGGGGGTQSEYVWSTSTVKEDPGHGRIRANDNVFPNVTELYVSYYDRNDIVTVGLIGIKEGHDLAVYEAANIDSRMRFTVTGPGVTGPSGEWATIPVTPVTIVGDGPGNNNVVVLAIEIPADFVHVQSVSAATWTIDHNLGFYPNVTVVSSANDQVEGDVKYPTVDRVVVTFSGAFAGRAFLS